MLLRPDVAYRACGAQMSATVRCWNCHRRPCGSAARRRTSATWRRILSGVQLLPVAKFEQNRALSSVRVVRLHGAMNYMGRQKQ